MWKYEGPRISQCHNEKKKKKTEGKRFGGLMLSHNKICYKAAVIGQHGIGTEVNKKISGPTAPERVPHL